MGIFSDVLLTVDFDRTLTGPDSQIPERNLEAIRFFMDNGGSFTVNTGRSIPTFRRYLEVVPVNAPLLLYNGSAAYESGGFVRTYPIELDLWDTVAEIADAFPDMNLEIQGRDHHYLVNEKPEYVAFYEAQGWEHVPARAGEDIGPFLKLALFGAPHGPGLDDMYRGTAQEIARIDQVEKTIQERYGDKVETVRPAPRIIDVQARGVSKKRAARDLKQELGKKILVCVGDAENDISMLEGADYGFCPADGIVADRFPSVCKCGEGAVADVIYKKIPEILGIDLDNWEKS